MCEEDKNPLLTLHLRQHPIRSRVTTAGNQRRRARNCQDLWIGVSRDLLVTSDLLA